MCVTHRLHPIHQNPFELPPGHKRCFRTGLALLVSWDTGGLMGATLRSGRPEGGSTLSGQQRAADRRAGGSERSRARGRSRVGALARIARGLYAILHGAGRAESVKLGASGRQQSSQVAVKQQQSF